jgi:hypothetical protein
MRYGDDAIGTTGHHLIREAGMPYRLGGLYAEKVFAPKRWGWAESEPGIHVDAESIAELRAAGHELHTWTCGPHVVTLAMKGDTYIHCAFLDDVALGTDASGIESALDALEHPEPLSPPR